MKLVVKITETGRVKLRLSKSLKTEFLRVLILFIQYTDDNIRRDRKLTYHNNDSRVYNASLQEVFLKHHTQLSIIDQESKITLTRVQAHVFWGCCMEWSDDAFQNPQMGGMLVDLHKALS